MVEIEDRSDCGNGEVSAGRGVQFGRVLRKTGFLLIGHTWPFVVTAVCVFIHVHVVGLPEWTFYLALAVMGLGLIGVGSFLAFVVPRKIHAVLRWVLILAVTGGTGFGLYVLVIGFSMWFHFAIGGSC